MASKVQTAREMGRQAFKSGTGRAPALCARFNRWMVAEGFEAKGQIAVMTAWLAGWDTESMKGWTAESLPA